MKLKKINMLVQNILIEGYRVRVFNATFNNISVIS